MRRAERKQDIVQLHAVTSPEVFLGMQSAIEEVYVHPDVQGYIVDLVGQTRQQRQVVVGASPRGSLALFKPARAWAAMEGRSFVTPDDVKQFTQPALAHRVILDPSLWEAKTTDQAVIRSIVQSVPVPVLPA